MSANDKVEVKGGCHCGHIRYTFTVKPEALTTGVRCNCTFCQKLSNQGVHVAPADFKLLSPASTREVGDYSSQKDEAAAEHAHRYFCQTCGVHVWMQARYEMGGQMHDHFAVSLRSIDQPQDCVDLSAVKFQYLDGRNDNFMELRGEPWPNGLL